MAESDPESTPSVRALELGDQRLLAVVDWQSYAHLGLGVLGLVALVAVTGSATDSLTKVVIGGVLALALDTPVRLLQDRGLARGAATAAVGIGLFAALAAVALLLVPPAVREASSFSRDLPATLDQFSDFPLVGDRLAEADLAERSDRWLEELPGTIDSDSVNELMRRAVLGVAGVVQVLLVTLALLLDGETIVRRARSLVPEHLRARLDRGGTLVYETLGRYFAGSLTLAILNGLYILTVGLILGVPLVILAAIWVMITNLIPQIGGFLGGSVFVVLALTEGALTGAIAGALFVAYMSTENYLIAPAIVGKAVNLSPPTTMIAAIVGGTAGGVPGALVATPLVGSAKTLFLAARNDEGEVQGPDGLDDAEVAELGRGADGP